MLAPIQTLIRRAADAMGSNKRRGTVLLLVLGSLALVLILAVVYAALGKGDRRTARETLVRKDAISNIDGVADHILDVLGRDVFNLVPEVTNSDAISLLGASAPIMRRETVDMPVTDAFFTSVPGYLLGGSPLTGRQNQNTVAQMRFNPDGGHNADLIWDEFTSDVPAFSMFAVDPRTASDPFLASTRPVDLGASNLPLDTPPYLRALDWAQISNFAPDGRFVNLFYLRDDAPGGGFAAPSLDLTRDPDSNNARLSLMNEDGNPTSKLPYEMMAGTGPDTADADWNKPFHWTMNQRRLFRPVNDPAFDTSPLGDPGSAEYWAYQYADADGDGILDSRWIELVDYTNPIRPVALLGDSDMRFFIAARAIDLSSLVNVATATDFLAPSTTAYRLGAGPQDISLFKLLNFSEHTLVHAIPQDINTDEGINYDDAFTTGTGQAGDYGSWSLPIAQALGRKSYLRLFDGSEQGSIQPYGTVPGEINPDRVLSNDIRDYTLNQTAKDRSDYANAIGSVYPGITAGGNSRTSPYSIDDLVELLTFHGINDDRNFSKLEQAMSANNTENIPFSSFSELRSDSDTANDAWAPIGQNVYDLKLMRSAVDIRRMLTTVSGSRPLRSSILDQANYAALSDAVDRKILLDPLVLSDGTYPSSTNGTPMQVKQQLDDKQGNLIANTFRVYLDLLAPDLNQQDWDRTDTDRFNTTSTQYYGHMGPELATRLAGHMALNFRDMADAPYVIDPMTGLPDGNLMMDNSDPFDILDLDLSVTPQLEAYNRRVDEPSVAVLRLSESLDLTTDTGILGQLWNAGSTPADGTGPIGLKLDINKALNPVGTRVDQLESYLASDPTNVSHEAMILYGVEPQPFLSQVSSMVMYTDKPHGNDGTDADILSTHPDTGEWDFQNGPTGNPEIDGTVNIDGDVRETNEDFLFQALFFQVFNPFDVPIVLDHYYIEYGDSFFSVTDGASLPVVLQPRTTAVLWTTNPSDTQTLNDRLTSANITLPPVSSSDPAITPGIEAMIANQIGDEVQRIKLKTRIGKASGSIVASSYSRIDPTKVQDFFVLGPDAKSDVNRVVMLWRDNPDVTDPATGRIDWAGSAFGFQVRATDQLVDRLRDTSDYPVVPVVGSGSVSSRSALDRRLNLPEITTRILGLKVQDGIKGYAAHRAAPDIIDPPSLGYTFRNYNYEMQLGVALWGNVSRKDDSTYDSGKSAFKYYTANSPTPGMPSGTGGLYDVVGTPVGALPAKVFEATTSGPNPFAGSNFLEHTAAVAGNGVHTLPEGLDILDDFNEPSGSDYPGVTDTSTDALWDVLQLGAVKPDCFVGLGKPVFGRNATVTLTEMIDPSPSTGKQYNAENYLRVTMNQTEFQDLLSGRRNLRVGDMLLPLAVGSYRTPLEVGPGGEAATPDGIYSENVLTRIGQYEAQWTTLGEALAAAAGYSDAVGPGGGVTSGGPKDPFADLSFSHASGIPNPKAAKYVLDRGQLRLDAFVPFLDMDPNDNVTEGVGDFTQNVDIRRGLGIPMALALFDLAQAGSDLGVQVMGSISQPVVGTINVNTAEPETLRLSPALAMDMVNASGARDPDRLWWPRELQNTVRNSADYQINAFRDTTNRAVDFADVGSTITAYRDPARYTRLHIGNGGLAGGSSMLTEISAFNRVLIDSSNAELGIQIDRETNTGIEAIRAKQGILSMGELFAARDLSDPDVQHQMGGFARDKRTMGLGVIDTAMTPATNTNYGRGIDFPIQPAERTNREFATFGQPLTGDLIGYAMNYGASVTDPRTFPGYPGMDGDPLLTADNPMLPIMPDQIPDSYDEQLVQLNAVLNSMSVRSDYYAVWFVVQGYKETDTLDFQPTDPLTPSFQARYLMIVDRSNVTEKGQKPKVLAFVQLPMLPAPPGTF